MGWGLPTVGASRLEPHSPPQPSPSSSGWAKPRPQFAPHPFLQTAPELRVGAGLGELVVSSPEGRLQAQFSSLILYPTQQANVY